MPTQRSDDGLRNFHPHELGERVVKSQRAHCIHTRAIIAPWYTASLPLRAEGCPTYSWRSLSFLNFCVITSTKRYADATIVLPAAIAASISSLIPRDRYQRQVARQPGKCYKPFDATLVNCLYIPGLWRRIAISPRSRRRGSVATAAASSSSSASGMPDLLFSSLILILGSEHHLAPADHPTLFTFSAARRYAGDRWYDTSQKMLGHQPTFC